MQTEIKKKISNLFGRGFSISKISKSLGISSDEVSRHIRKIIKSKTRKDKLETNIINFPNHKTIQVKNEKI